MASEEYQLSCNFDGESICQCYIAQILSKQGLLWCFITNAWLPSKTCYK